MRSLRKRRCPRCRAHLIQIVYGDPTDEAGDAAMRGEVILGGCLVFEGHPDRRCPGCGREWRRVGRGSHVAPEMGP